MKVSELTGALLDYWVAKALGAKDADIEDWGGMHNVCVTAHNAFEKVPFLPSTKWTDGGPIIERERIMLEPVENWVGHIYANQRNYAYVGNTPLIAAMRCYVASKFGEEVEDVPHA